MKRSTLSGVVQKNIRSATGHISLGAYDQARLNLQVPGSERVIVRAGGLAVVCTGLYVPAEFDPTQTQPTPDLDRIGVEIRLDQPKTPKGEEVGDEKEQEDPLVRFMGSTIISDKRQDELVDEQHVLFAGPSPEGSEAYTAANAGDDGDFYRPDAEAVLTELAATLPEGLKFRIGYDSGIGRLAVDNLSAYDAEGGIEIIAD